MSKQLLRCGTSIGANIEVAIAASSKADFIHKLNIAAKEARETSYWLRLLKDSNYFPENEFFLSRRIAWRSEKLLAVFLKPWSQIYNF